MNLNEIRTYITRLDKKLRTLQKHRRDIAKVSIVAGENYNDYIDMTVQECTRQINNYCDVLTYLHTIMVETNVKTSITIDGQPTNITAALYSIKNSRKELKAFEEFADAVPRARDSYNSDNILVATYDISYAKKEAERLDEYCEGVSREIENINANTFVDINMDFIDSKLDK